MGSGWAWIQLEETVWAEAILSAAGLETAKKPKRAFDRFHGCDGCARWRIPGYEESSASLSIIKSFVKTKRISQWCCAYLIWTVEKFPNHHWLWD